MKYFKNKYGFTLIELLIVIAIIGILIFSITSINYNRLSINQKNEIFVNSIKTNFETIRNYSLSGKGIGVDLIVPDNWQLEFSNTGSGKIETKYSSGSNFYIYNSLDFIGGREVSFIKCLRLDKTEDNEIMSGTGIIEIKGDKLKLGGDCTNSTSKILQIGVNFRGNEEIIEFNTLNGLVEIK